MDVRRFELSALLLAVAALLWLAAPASACEWPSRATGSAGAVPATPTPAPEDAADRPFRNDTDPPSDSAPDTAPAGAAAQRMFVDPETGRIVAEPPAAERGIERMSGRMRAGTSTSHRGLVEEPAPLGAVKVDLRGRFKTLLTGTVGPDGHLRVGHAGHAPTPSTDTGDGEGEEAVDEMP